LAICSFWCAISALSSATFARATASSAATSSAFAPLGRQRLFQGGNLIQNRLAIGVHAMQ
jgi:hypothetical protein